MSSGAGNVEPVEFESTAGGTLVRGEAAGEGRDVFLCHGLSATRRYVVHGSKVLPRKGYRVVTYDARGHGESDPAADYGYEHLADDLEGVIESHGASGDLILGGHSMGCHTVVTAALRDPSRVAALILIGPVYTGEESETEAELGPWDERADALERGGPAEFARVIGERVTAPEPVREKIMQLAQGRAELHRHPEAVAEALRQVPRSKPFGSVDELSRLDVPTLVVASHDEADDGHPYAVAERYAEVLPQAKMISEDKGDSPLSWQGGRLSREIAGFLETNDLGPAAG